MSILTESTNGDITAADQDPSEELPLLRARIAQLERQQSMNSSTSSGDGFVLVAQNENEVGDADTLFNQNENGEEMKMELNLAKVKQLREEMKDLKEEWKGRKQYQEGIKQHKEDMKQYNEDMKQYKEDMKQYNEDMQQQYNEDMKQRNEDMKQYKEDMKQYNEDMQQQYNEDMKQYKEMIDTKLEQMEEWKIVVKNQMEELKQQREMDALKQQQNQKKFSFNEGQKKQFWLMHSNMKAYQEELNQHKQKQTANSAEQQKADQQAQRSAAVIGQKFSNLTKNQQCNERREEQLNTLIRHNLASFTVDTDVELIKRVDFAYAEAYSAYVSHNLPIANITMGVDPPQHFEGVNSLIMRYKQAYSAYARSSANQSCGTMVVDPQQLDRLMNMSRAERWLKFANELTNVTKCSIEFAKMVKEFVEVEQDHRILALKKAAFELALIVMAQHYHQPSQTLRVHNMVLPVDKFCCTDKEDEEFGKELISVLKLLSSFQLNGTETALLCAFVLMEQTPGMDAFVGQLKKWLGAKLHQRMPSNAGDKALRELFECLARLRELAKTHRMCFGRFRLQMMIYHPTEQQQASRGAEANVLGNFPPIYTELFANSD
ncbi:hypothetical protein GPALN_003160 [Globodera pallida]|nr:hypothetical protein GPALN_003160 [Globodera pallida]